MQFKKDKHLSEAEEITVEGEWLNGVPHGVCIVDSENFRGVCTFTHGKIQDGPGWSEDKSNGERKSCEYLDDGLPKGVIREYYSDT